MIGTDGVLSRLVHSGKLAEFLANVDPMNFEEFSQGVILSLRSAVQSIEKNADKYYNLTEEQLSTTISLLLERSGYNTKNEPSNRGHIDIYVEKNHFSWLIEAKIGYDNQKIFEGLLQLASRYLTDQSSACLLLYFRQADIKATFQNWQDFLQKKEWVTYATNNNILDKCTRAFDSTKVTKDSYCFGYSFLSNIKTTSGDTVNIYHVGANIHFHPFDSSGRDGVQLRKNQAKIYFEHIYQTRQSGVPLDEAKIYQELNNYFDFDKSSNNSGGQDKSKGRKAKTPGKKTPKAVKKAK
ncbi:MULTISPECIES: hypothetical protein [Enterobacter]|uniref:hypothetical protein n=1 Tax=Enterobacter TaxID=547 RepID=UPI0023667FD9|nr:MULTISPECIES: hypothetical protein [unclassified Enterobacter]HDR2401498.1 hypothetical protein [Enterobacter bugandensis]